MPGSGTATRLGRALADTSVGQGISDRVRGDDDDDGIEWEDAFDEDERVRDEDEEDGERAAREEEDADGERADWEEFDDDDRTDRNDGEIEDIPRTTSVDGDDIRVTPEGDNLPRFTPDIDDIPRVPPPEDDDIRIDIDDRDDIRIPPPTGEEGIRIPPPTIPVRPPVEPGDDPTRFRGRSDDDDDGSGLHPHIVQYDDESGYRWTVDLLTGDRDSVYTGIPGDPTASFQVVTETTTAPREWMFEDGTLLISAGGVRRAQDGVLSVTTPHPRRRRSRPRMQTPKDLPAGTGPEILYVESPQGYESYWGRGR